MFWRRKGLIKRRKHQPEHRFCSTAAAFSGGQGIILIEFEPSATLLEQKGDGYVVASVGTESGYVPYTSYSVKQSYLKMHGATVEKFTKALQKGMDFVQTHTPEEIAEVDCAAVWQKPSWKPSPRSCAATMSRIRGKKI